MKILITGGQGNLGRELIKYVPEHEIVAPTMEEMDITKPETYLKNDFNMVIHCAAYIDLVKAENEDKILCYMTNVLGTKWLAQFYKDSDKFVYISSEYASNPVNWYSWTKLWGEDVVRRFRNHLIIRTSFKYRPFKYDKACIDQWTCADYIDVIAPMIVKKLGKSGLVWVGTERKTTYELAKQTRPDVEPCLVDDIKTVNLPKDYILEN